MPVDAGVCEAPHSAHVRADVQCNVPAMSDPLFREEALDYLNRRGGPGDLLQVGSPWLDRAYLGFLTLVLVGALAAAWYVSNA